eukprot:Pgem_evm2s4813
MADESNGVRMMISILLILTLENICLGKVEYDEDDANQEPTIPFKEFLAESVLVYQAAMNPGSHAIADETITL